MRTGALKAYIDSKDFLSVLSTIYHRKELERQKDRYRALLDSFTEYFPGFDEKDAVLVSSPGRTELGGNHTDHNNGRVLAASINLDGIGIAVPIPEKRVELVSVGFSRPFIVDLAEVSPRNSEEGKTEALIRGMAAGLENESYKTGGFKAVIQSEVLPGSGLSSSASLELLIGSILNELYNDGSIQRRTIARIGQFAENEYFGKPCGLMDQLACANGGIIAIDFSNPQQPNIDSVSVSFEEYGYALIVLDTGSSHADLTDDYAAIPKEMRQVAGEMGKENLGDCNREDFENNLAEIKKKVSDRAILRALHFFSDNERVVRQKDFLSAGRVEEYLVLVRASASSSWRLLQNAYSCKNPGEQGISLALALSERFIEEECCSRGACRVHGGGFAGTIQVYLPLEKEEVYRDIMERIFGKDCIKRLRVRQKGSLCLGRG